MTCHCPACGCSAAEHAARQINLQPAPLRHDWAQPRGYDSENDLYRCIACGEGRLVPVVVRGETLKAYLRGECKGVQL